MLNLLNALNADSAMFWLLVALGILLIVEVAVFAILMVRHNRRRNPELAVEQRRLIGITLDPSMVQREYKVGEQFDPSGLVVLAHYNDEPYEEALYKFAVVTPELLQQLASESKKPEDYEGVLVYVPALSVVGKPTVTVAYKDQVAAFAISVVEPVPVPAPVVPKPEPKLIGLKLNTDMTRKTFTVGDTFETKGLIVIALYDAEPYTERVYDFVVLPPDISKAGKPFVTVNYKNQSVDYLVNVVEPEPEPEVVVAPKTVVIEEAPEVIHIQHDPIVIEEESFEGGTLRYDRSFTARLIQSEDELKHWYTEIKNYLLSFKKVKDRMSWKRESYRYGREPVARLGYRGKTLCVYLPLDPNEYLESKYKVEDVSDNSSYVDTPCMYRLKNVRRVKYAMELIDVVMERFNGGVRIERDSVDYYVPYEGLVELINKGLIKRNIKSKEDEAFFEEKQRETEVAAAEAPEAK